MPARRQSTSPSRGRWLQSWGEKTMENIEILLKNEDHVSAAPREVALNKY